MIQVFTAICAVVGVLLLTAAAAAVVGSCVLFIGLVVDMLRELRN